MATTTASAWGKPGAWALDSEQHDAAELDKEIETPPVNLSYTTPHQKQQQAQPLSDFPALSVAAATKTKKKKPQSVSLAEFSTGKSVTHGSAKAAQIGEPKGLTADELLILPTGPRERSAEELERGSRGFRSYGDRDSNREERRPFNRDSNREGGALASGPSRADEADDWGAKKSVSPFDRRERGGGFFENSQSRADESDNWGSKKSFVPSEPRRSAGFGERRGGYEGFQKEGSNGGGGADSETWGRRREEGPPRGFQKESFNATGGADSDTWGKKREEGVPVVNGGGRPRLVLQPRTVPVTSEEQRPGSGSGSRSKGSGSNPFGAARPREEVLKEKGQDWKELDEKLEAVKIKEMSAGASDGPSFGRKSFGSGNGRTSSPEDRVERSWKKAVLAEPSTPSEEKATENGSVAENGVTEN